MAYLSGRNKLPPKAMSRVPSSSTDQDARLARGLNAKLNPSAATRPATDSAREIPTRGGGAIPTSQHRAHQASSTKVSPASTPSQSLSRGSIPADRDDRRSPARAFKS